MGAGIYTFQVQGMRGGNPGRWKIRAGSIGEARLAAKQNGIDIVSVMHVKEDPPPEPPPAAEPDAGDLPRMQAEAELLQLRRDVEQLRGTRHAPAAQAAAPRRGRGLVTAGIVLMVIAVPLFCLGGIGALPFAVGLILLIVGLCLPADQVAAAPRGASGAAKLIGVIVFGLLALAVIYNFNSSYGSCNARSGSMGSNSPAFTPSTTPRPQAARTPAPRAHAYPAMRRSTSLGEVEVQLTPADSYAPTIVNVTFSNIPDEARPQYANDPSVQRVVTDQLREQLKLHPQAADSMAFGFTIGGDLIGGSTMMWHRSTGVIEQYNP